MNWHTDSALLQRYLEGGLDIAATLSIEAHVGGCAECRAKVPRAPDWLQASWLRVADQVMVPQLGRVENMLVRGGLPAPMARLLTATPALRRSWWVAVAALLTFAVVAAHAAADQRGMLMFLTLAPLIPVVSVAAAYGRRADPLHELTVAVPLDGLRLVLIRAVAVLCAAMVMGLLALPLLPSLGWTAAGWLLPALALTTVTLALGSWLDPVAASGIVTGVWLVAVWFVTGPARDPLIVFRAGTQLWFAALFALAGLVLTVRRHTWEKGV